MLHTGGVYDFSPPILKTNNNMKKEIIDFWFWNRGLTYKEIAKRFKVSISTVGRAIRNCIYY